ncbi:kinase-like protein [Pseudovirgaria hyperparasitica]|uniref:Kinase-like protein n=1 Tax=Pseudovirgaria hyperparasitica TaxID=470096 RepID=A0A6A6WJZ8_9PEZI|nr:kinase-like protein [Pseudovirgaria hyperparasitica]KAF2761991.1 kinase-like protein [Pseudovirgaria hyperparasitica]
MALRIGQVLRGAAGKYELVEALKGCSVFKARVLSSRTPSSGGEWAMIKTATSDDEKMVLRREYRNYGIRDIASCAYIRRLRDVVAVPAAVDGEEEEEGGGKGGEGEEMMNTHDPDGLVFEWMDTDLRCVPASRFRGDARLPKGVSRAVLSALDVFRTLGLVHTDVSVNNVFVSDLDGASPVAKLGDLGNLIVQGSTTQRGQSLPCRAPEVWQGLGCRHSSDIWSLGVTLARRLSPHAHFGASDKIIEGHTEAWCIAKIIRRCGPIPDPPADQHNYYQPYREEFALAEQLAVMDNPHDGTRLIKGGTLREELLRLAEPPVSEELVDFIEALLVVDHGGRPVASEALRHAYLRSST